jgi:hypothetical protein
MIVHVLSNTDARRILPDELKEDDRLYYFGVDYLAFRKLKIHFKGKGQVLLPGKLFHESVSNLENDFLKFFQRIISNNQSDLFWETSFASRNSASMPLLRQMGYYRCAVQLLSEGNGKLFFVCESAALADLLRKVANDMGLTCPQTSSLPDFTSMLRIYCKLIMRALYFLAESMSKWVYTRLIKNKRIDKSDHRQRFIIRSWVTAGCLDKEGKYVDRNFGVLPEYLIKNGVDVWTMPMFFNLDRSIFNQMKLMVLCGRQLLFPEQYFSAWDVMRTVRDGFASLFLDLSGCIFDGRDFSGLVMEVHLQTALSQQLLSYNMAKYAIKKMADDGVKIDRFIYAMENTAAEKPFIIACRRFYPETEIVGFQHTAWFKEQMCVFLDQGERAYHPLPDRIIVSGRRYLDILTETGFPKNMICLGPNLRYPSINKAVLSVNNEHHKEPKSILLILNFDPDQTLEFLEKVRESLVEIPFDQIYIKAHPLYPVKRLAAFLRSIEFPPYRLVSGTVQEWLTCVGAVLMTGGSISNLEAMASGCPLIRVSLDGNFDFDSLWDDYPFAPFVHTSSEISFFLEKALSLDDHQKRELMEFGLSLIDRYFEPVSEDNLKVFLQA